MILLFGASCNKDEGLGGSSSIEGYVYSVVHQSDDYFFTPDTIPAVGERVYIVYGGDENAPIADKDVRTNLNGMYCFQFLRKGNYIVYALSSYPKELNSENVAELQRVQVGSETALANPIYIHSGSGYGFAMIKGTVWVQYYDRSFRPSGDPVPAVDTRVYLKRTGDETYIDDVRVGDNGVFIFTKVSPGKYEIYTTTEEIGNRNKIFPFSIPFDPERGISEIEITAPHKMYELPQVQIILNL
jgi:hypothetical protein